MNLNDELTTAITPGDDFYNFVNKKWCDAHPIPNDKARYSAMSQLDEKVIEQLRDLLESPVKSTDSDNSILAKTLYQSGMNEALIEEHDIEPVMPLIEEILSITTGDDLKKVVIKRHGEGRSLVWSLNIDVDEKNSSRYMMQISQGGLLLPDRDYYFEKGENFEKTRTAYKHFLEQLFESLELGEAAIRANNVYSVEEKLASISNTSTEDRDVDAKYNLYTFDELIDEFPGFEWKQYQLATGLSDIIELIIQQPNFVKRALALFDEITIDEWKDYLIAHSVTPMMRLLSKRYVDLSFSFFGKVLTGAQEQEARYKRTIRNVNALLPEPAGQLYVEAHFDENAKAAITELVSHIQHALGNRIKTLEWMSDETKKRALEKLGTFMPLLGYPDSWRLYDGLILGDNYAENVIAIRKFEWQYDVTRLTGPVNRKEWLMSPATVNAYYWPNTNGITFPAAILQPPFFDASGDYAANYGGIGAVIGHEITHGFDDKGSKYDKNGNLNSWWTDQDRAAFDKRAQVLIDQFNTYEVNGQKVKGELTQGENIADLGGILIALDAMKEKSQEIDGDDRIDGLSPQERFFMAYAKTWRLNIRPELSLQFLVSDPHSPAHLRVNGVVTNVDEFYDVYKLKDGDKLYRSIKDRVRIW